MEWQNDERFLQAVEFVLQHETGGDPNGGYVNHPDDPGGETKWGISKRSYPHLDIPNLTREEAIEIYYNDWWKRYRIDEIADDVVACKVLDMAVLMGPGDAFRYLQIALNSLGERVVVDGILGSETLGAVNNVDGRIVLFLLRAMAALHVYNEANQRPQSAAFLAGWFRRSYS